MYVRNFIPTFQLFGFYGRMPKFLGFNSIFNLSIILARGRDVQPGAYPRGGAPINFTVGFYIEKSVALSWKIRDSFVFVKRTLKKVLYSICRSRLQSLPSLGFSQWRSQQGFEGSSTQDKNFMSFVLLREFLPLKESRPMVYTIFLFRLC